MSETTFDKLPREVLGIILDDVDPTDQQKFRRISHYWNKNVCSLYGATIGVNNKNCFFNLSSTAWPIRAYIQSLTHPIPMNETGKDFLNRLTSLTFTGHVVCYNVLPILEHCMFVRKLELISFNPNLHMKEYEVNKEDPSKLLPELRTLTIKFSSTPFLEPEYTFLKTLMPFLTSTSGKLTSITLDSPQVSGPLGIAFNNIFKKNSFQPPTEDMIELGLSGPRVNVDDSFYIELVTSNRQSLQNLEMADGQYGCRLKMKLLPETLGSGDSEIQFTGFDQSLHSHSNTYYFFLDHITLLELLKPQTHLNKFSIGLTRTLTLDHACSIANNNANTLGYFTIWYFEGYQVGRLDASALSKLTVLKMFKYSKYESESMRSFFGEQSIERINNIKCLPSSLRSFTTTAALEFEDQTNFNMNSFENLEHLVTFELLTSPFFYFGMERIFKMNATKIRQLISWLPSLKKLVLRNQRPYTFQMFNGQNVEEDEEEEEEEEEGAVDFHARIDTLPNSATAWINNDPRISYEKIPISYSSSPTYGNPALIGQQYEWDLNQALMGWNEHNTNHFPELFDGVILIGRDFRAHNPLPE